MYDGGTLFELNGSGMETILYSFCKDMNTFGNCDDGNGPSSAPLLDALGNLYGTTGGGGLTENDYGSGTIYMVTPEGVESLLYSFQYLPDGQGPTGLVRDAQGNFYGTAYSGGGEFDCADFSCGTAWEVVVPHDYELTLHQFTGGADGGNPAAPLVWGPNGNLFGTTVIGGTGNCSSDNQGQGCGTVFGVSPNAKQRVIHTFTGGADGAFPQAALVTDGNGHAYGTSAGSYFGGNYGYGTVFEISQ